MRTVLLSVFVVAILALPLHAQEQKPNTLTRKEIADGWILLFDGETTFGWKADGKPLKVAEGALIPSSGNLFSSTARFAEFELHFEYKKKKEGRASFGVDVLLGDVGRQFNGLSLAAAEKWSAGTIRSSGGKVEMMREVGGGQIPPFALGRLCFSPDEDSNLMLRNIKLKPLNTKSIFNGKDLTGWKEFPGRKSKFTVTDKGELNVKNGNGDLQTVGKYQDFILQLECISNGKWLNSGIFFRCKADEYQNGYEAQIFNKFSKDATQKYLVEEYDPKTNKLVAKKEVMSPAFDYGTGAIYRRVPARKEMSKDSEWFGMTIVAHGNHLATWVNGVQVVDWYDNRPKSDNPRNGCRLEAGHISIQGHDPTTDLNFKNFRIAELPATK